MSADVSFTIHTRIEQPGLRPRGRRGTINTPHGAIDTPAFVPVGTAATVKTLTPQQIRATGASAVLANAYHLALRPGADVVDAGGGLARFMRWDGPTYTDSGGFQIMSLGSGYKKVIDMAPAGESRDGAPSADPPRRRLAVVDDDGVTFRSHLDGSRRRFTPEVSMQTQHALGADIIFAFDELTTLHDSRAYHLESVERTRRWAERCLREHDRLTRARPHRPLQSLWGVVQGAHYEDLRRHAVRGLLDLSAAAVDEGRRGFGGFGIGGALEKHRLGEIVGWCVDDMPETLPRHLLGISEPDDMFAAIDHGADTFDCVAPTRMARHGHLMTRDGRLRMRNARHARDHSPVDPTSDAPVAHEFTRAYLHHLFKAAEPLAATIATIINVRFVVRLMEETRVAITDGRYPEFKNDTLRRYYGAGGAP